MLKKTAHIFNKIKMMTFVFIVVLFAVFSTFGNSAQAAADTKTVNGYACPSMKILEERYNSDCFPCQIVKVLIASFMRAAAKVYDVSREAGSKLLLFGSAIWLVFWALKKVSSLTNPEPMAMMNELVIFFGKVIVAFVFINSGVGTLVGYAINPILAAGADYGSSLLAAGSSGSNVDLSAAPAAENAYNGPTEIVSEEVMNKILRFSEGVSNEIATNMVIGSALSCFAVQQGYHWTFLIELHIPDIWLWLCGAAIWIVGFLLTLSVCYYLIDIPFKLGFAILALPVVIGLWPFKITTGKLKSVVMIAVNAAGTFLFLALAVSYAMVLISASLRGKDQLFEAFAKDDVKYVQSMFEITGPYFIIILFCYIYGFKMIGDISESMPKRFFGGHMASGADSPMHSMATAATGWLKQKAMAPVKMAGNIVANQAGKAATTMAKAATNVGLGAAGYAAGAAGNKLGKGISFVGKKMSSNAGNAKAQLDEDGRLLDMNQATTTSKLGNRFQSGIAGMMGKTGQLIDKAGQQTSAGSNKIKAPMQNTVSHVGDAYSASTDALKDAVKETASLMPKGAGEAMARVGNFFVKQTEDQVFAKDANGLVKRDKNGKPIENISARLTNKIGGKMASLGTHIVDNNRVEKMATAADSRLVAQKEKYLESKGKVASYIPGGMVRKLGLALQRDANGSALSHGISMDTMLANSIGSKLSSIGKFAQQNQAPKDGIRSKIQASYANIKGDTALKTAWNGLKAGSVATVGGVVQGGAYVFNAKNDWKHLKDQFGVLKKTTTNFRANTTEQLKSNLNNVADSAIGTVNSAAGFGQSYKQDVKEAWNQMGDHSGTNSELKATRMDAGQNAKIVVKNLFNIRGIADAVHNRKEVNDFPEELVKGIGRDIRDVALMPAAAILGGKLMAEDVLNTATEAAYSAGIHSAFVGIDAANMILTAIPLKQTGGVMMEAGATVGAVGKAVLGLPGQAVNMVEDTAKTIGYAAKLVVNIPLRAVGGTIGFAAKTVDNTLYAAYKMTVTPTLAVGGMAVNKLGVGYRTVAATRAGKEVNRAAHIVRGTAKVGLRTIQIATNMIKAAAGEGSRRPAKILTPQEKARQAEEKKKMKDEEAKKADIKHREKERLEREEREHEREKEQREREEELARQREEEQRRLEEARQLRLEEEAERLRVEEEERRRRSGGKP